jgi:VanZ family protein
VKLPRVFHHPLLWSSAFILWFLVLWSFSSGKMPELPTNGFFQVDKIYHFGYYFGGSGLCCAALHTWKRGTMLPHHMLTWSVLILTTSGCIDEWHQSWVEGRSGNDSMDLMADFLGAVAGFYVFRRFIPLFRRDKGSST